MSVSRDLRRRPWSRRYSSIRVRWWEHTKSMRIVCRRHRGRSRDQCMRWAKGNDVRVLNVPEVTYDTSLLSCLTCTCTKSLNGEVMRRRSCIGSHWQSHHNVHNQNTQVISFFQQHTRPFHPCIVIPPAPLSQNSSVNALKKHGISFLPSTQYTI